MKARNTVRIPKADDERLLSLCKLAIEKIMPGNAFVAVLPSLFILSTNNFECRHPNLEHRNLNGESPNLNGESPNLNGEPRNLNGESPNLNGEPRNLNGESPNLNGEPRNLNGESPNLNGESRNLNGESRNLNGEPLNLNGESRNHDSIGERQTELWLFRFCFIVYLGLKISDLHVESRHPP